MILLYLLQVYLPPTTLEQEHFSSPCYDFTCPFQEIGIQHTFSWLMPILMINFTEELTVFGKN